MSCKVTSFEDIYTASECLGDGGGIYQW